MQYKVPQNIDMADRIVGPLTLVQFLYLLVGGLIVYTLFSTLGSVNPTLFVLTGGPVALLTVAMTFLKIQDQPFPRFFVAFLLYLSRPKARIWHKEGLDPELVITPDVKKTKTPPVHKKIEKSELDKLAQVLDAGGTVKITASEKSKTTHATPPSYIKRSRPTLDTMKRK